MKSIRRRLKRTVKKVGRSVDRVVSTPFRMTRELVKGDVSGALKEGGRGIGGGLQILNAANPLAWGESEKALNTKLGNKLTFGLTGNLYDGLYGGADTLAKKGRITRTEFRNLYQGLAKVGGAYAGGLALGAYAPSAMTGSNAVIGYSAAQKAVDGDIFGAVTTLGGVEGISSPDMPSFLPEFNTPDWLKDWGGAIGGFLPGAGGTGPQQYADPGTGSPRLPITGQNNTLLLAMGAVVILGAIAIARR